VRRNRKRPRGFPVVTEAFAASFDSAGRCRLSGRPRILVSLIERLGVSLTSLVHDLFETTQKVLIAMRALRLPGLALLGSVCLAPGAVAEPVFLMHAQIADFSACESIDEGGMRCNDFNASPGSNNNYFAWVIVGDVGGELSGAAFGIDYESTISVATWVGCSGLQIPGIGWPSPESGIALAYDAGCHSTAANDLAALGFFYVQSGSQGFMHIIEHPDMDHLEAGRLIITNCGENPESERCCEHSGRLAFGGAGGYVPGDCRCSGPPAVEASWGGIKDEFRNAP